MLCSANNTVVLIVCRNRNSLIEHIMTRTNKNITIYEHSLGRLEKFRLKVLLPVSDGIYDVLLLVL